MKWLNGYRIRWMLAGFIIAGFLGDISMCQAAEPVWTQRADMPTPRWMPTSAAVNGKIYVIGGVSSEPSNWQNESGEILSTVEEYDPATDTWTRKADMPTARGWIPPSSPVVDGKIYVIGGGGIDDVNWCNSTVEMYDPATDTWTRKADMPTPRWCLAACAVDGKIYAIGGAPNSYKGLSTVEEYDPATDTWTRKADMPWGIWGLSTSVVNGKIYAIGGTPEIIAVNIALEYDPATDTWTKKSRMPTASRGMDTSALCGKIYTIGGWSSSGNTPYSTVQVYDPVTDTWTIEADAPFRRSCFSASVVNNRIYVIGGTNRGHPCPATSTVYEFGAPPPDFNWDGIVNAADMCIMVDHWGTGETLCDIAPPPFGDGIVDVQDLIVLAEYLFEEVYDPTLVAHWTLDEAEGDIACDSIGVNDGICHGEPLWQPADGKVGGALQLDGIDDYVSPPFILNPAKGSFSAFAWIKGGAPGQVIISQTEGYGGTWLGTNSSEGKLITGLSDVFFGALESESVITDGQWHHVGLVYDLASHRHLYVDGVEVNVDSNYVAGMPSHGGLYIGAANDLDAGSFWSGLIDDVRIYDVALTAEKIAALAH